jgi:glyoxylase-like metal-dependent hydrolase (beta-lactamase superfamily II)
VVEEVSARGAQGEGCAESGLPEVHSVWAGLGCPHLVPCARGYVLVDAGWPGYGASILRRIAQFGGEDLALIYITHAHFDHYGSAAELRRLTGAPIAIHEADLDAMARGETVLGSVRARGWLGKVLLPLAQVAFPPEPTRADLTVRDGDDLHDFGLEARVVHTPGHTPGSSSLLVSERVALVGDLVSTNLYPHAQRLYAHDWSAVAQSLARIKALRPDEVYSGHGRRPIDGATLQRLSPPSSLSGQGSGQRPP